MSSRYDIIGNVIANIEIDQYLIKWNCEERKHTVVRGYLPDMRTCYFFFSVVSATWGGFCIIFHESTVSRQK